MKLNKKSLLQLLYNIDKEFKNSYVVGGILRDIIIEKKFLFDTKEYLDIDIIIENLKMNKLKNIIQKINLPFVILDEENKIYRTIIKNDKIIINIDISSYTNLKEDILRRDFTINTLCIKLNYLIRYLNTRNKNLITKNLVDLTNRALKDIKNKVLSVVEENNIKEDPLRILRAARFICYGFRIDKKAENLCVKYKSLLKYVAKERINEEIKKIFNFNSYNVLEWLDKNKILEEVIPEIEILKVKGKNTKFKKFYFHKEGLWQHTKLTYKKLEKIVNNLNKYYPEYHKDIYPEIQKYVYLLKLASIFHDIAKPLVAKKEKNKVRFFHHEIESAEISFKILKDLKFSNDEIKLVYEIIKNHMRVGSLFNNCQSLTERAYLKLFTETEKFLYLLLIICLADRLSYEVVPIEERKKYFKNFQPIKKFIEFENLVLEKYKKYKIKSSLPKLINGYDVMKNLNISPGPTVGKILKLIEEAQILGKISTKNEAIKLAKQYYKKLYKTFVEKKC
ncbi:MAG: HD domain-containing protein [Endomicrobiia bacterium]